MDFRRPLPEIRWQSCLSPVFTAQDRGQTRVSTRPKSGALGYSGQSPAMSLAMLSMTTPMETRYSPTTVGYQALGTKELRSTFLVESLFAPEKLALRSEEHT